MKKLNNYIIEKLHLNKDIKIFNIKEFIPNVEKIMSKLNWFGPEYEINEKSSDKLCIKFKINIDINDAIDTRRGLEILLSKEYKEYKFVVNPGIATGTIYIIYKGENN